MNMFTLSSPVHTGAISMQVSHALSLYHDYGRPAVLQFILKGERG